MRNGEKRDGASEDRRQATVVIALRTGLLKKCLDHGEIYDPGQHDYQGACMVATYLVNSGNPLVESFQGDRVPLMESLRSICQSYGSACPLCSRPAAG
jgi:hypothetical protein